MAPEVVIRIVVGLGACAIGCNSSAARSSTGAGTAPAPSGACASDADCTLSCVSLESCCSSPCGCGIAMTTAEAAHAAAHYGACTPDDRAKCPTVGGCGPKENDTAARCRSGACVAETVPLATPSATAAPSPDKNQVDVTGFSRACKTAADCRIVSAFPCDHCICGSTPIAASERDRFAEAARKIRCDKPSHKVCSECRSFVPTCDDGACGAKPE